MLNNKGVLAIMVYVTMAVMGTIVTLGAVETTKSGVAKRNGKRIWCQMQGEAKSVCFDKYR